MADEYLTKAGLFIDDFNKLRLLDPEICEVFLGTHEKSKDFLSILKSFQSTSSSLIKSVEEFAKLVETEKIRAITMRNNDRLADSAHDPVLLQIAIRELIVERDRLRAELEAVRKIEREQLEFIAKLTEN